MISVKDHNTGVTTEHEKTGTISDGYHTFDELYRYRLLYNAAFFNQLKLASGSKESGQPYWFDAHKSRRHSDGELCFGGGWFVVVAQLPTGQITNHYEMNDWDLFDIPEREKAAKWDGHTPEDVEQRLTDFLKGKNE